MSHSKVSAIRYNAKLGLVQIKVNHGPNHILTGEDAKRFIKHRESLMLEGKSPSEANALAAAEFLNKPKGV